ncbi:MAG: diiron oxygenase [Steroidobacteraceae bacterium]
MSSLTELPQIRYEDPLVCIDWQAVDHECWWLPPRLLSLTGVPEFEQLDERTRQRLSHLEYVHLLEAGLWLESQFMARLARLAHGCADVARSARFLHELREEAGHSLMFVELLERSGFGVCTRRGLGMRAIDLLGGLLSSRSALFWAMVVIGEELPDQLNRRLRRGVEEATLSTVVYRIAAIHTRDEAMHCAFAREQCRESAKRRPAWQRALLAPALSFAIDLYARYVYFPSVATYARAGLTPTRQWRALALANPNRRAQVANMLRPTLEFLNRSGWRVSSRYCPAR